MSQTSPARSADRRNELAAFIRLWPLHSLLICGALAFGGPAWRAARMALTGSGQGGVQVDTAGASGHITRGQYMLDLPVEIMNGGSNMVLGVSLWVETYGCPDEHAPTAACRRLTSFEQYIPLRMQPQSAASQSQRMAGVAPGPGEVIRIQRKLQSIDDEGTTER